MSKRRTIAYRVFQPKVSTGERPTVTVQARRELKSGRVEFVELELQSCGWLGLAAFIDGAKQAATDHIEAQRTSLNYIEKRMGLKT